MLVNSVLSFNNQKYLQTFPDALMRYSIESPLLRTIGPEKEVPARPGAPYKPQVSKNKTPLMNNWSHFWLKF